MLSLLKATKPHDAGRVGMFLDGLKALEGDEKEALGRAILSHFDRKVLKRNKRWGELSPHVPR